MFARMLPQVAEPRKIPIRNKTASCPLLIGFKNVRSKTDR
jgi:hypothetical protein